MKVGRITLSAMVLMGAVALANCGDTDPAAPSHVPDSTATEAGLLGNVLNGLLACNPIPAKTVIKTIGSGGGTINIGPHTLVIPSGALAGNVSIKAVIKAESVNRVSFEPHGLNFRKDVTLTMSYANCGLLNALSVRQIAYVKPNLSILDHLLSFDNILARKVTTKLEHFSDYAVEQFSLADHVVAWAPGTSR